MRQIRSGVILSLIYIITHIIINLLYVPILLHGIGQDEYGLYQLVGSVIAYISIMQSLLSAGVLRYYCKYKALNDECKMENTLAIARRIYYAFSVIVAIAGVALYFVFASFYKSSLTAREIREAQMMIVLLSVNIIINLTNYVYTAAITAHEKFVFLKFADIISVLLQPITIILFIRKYPYALTIVCIQVIISLGLALARTVYSKYIIKVKIIYHGKDKELIKGILLFSLGVFFAAIADQIFWKTDQIILGKIYGTAVVAVYAVGSQIYTNYMPVGTAISGVFMPKVSQVYNVEKSNEKLSEIFIKVGRISFLMSAMVLCGFALYGKEFVCLWAGNGYEDAYYIALIVMIPFTVDIIQNIGLTILQVINKYTFRGVMYLIIAIINIVTTAFMAIYWGTIGAAIATAVSMFIGNGLIMNIYYKKVAKLNVKKFWWEILKILPAIIISLFIGALIKYIYVGNEWIDLILHVFIFMIVYSMTVYICAMNNYEKDIIRGLINKFKKKSKNS